MPDRLAKSCRTSLAFSQVTQVTVDQWVVEGVDFTHLKIEFNWKYFSERINHKIYHNMFEPATGNKKPRLGGVGFRVVFLGASGRM